MVKRVYRGLNRLLFPRKCPLTPIYPCPETDPGRLCARCCDQLIWNIPPFCVRCSRNLSRGESRVCRTCRRHPPDFDFAWSACLYKEPLRHTIHRFKYHHKTQYAAILASVTARFCERHSLDLTQFDALIPVPLHPARLRERGYNQARLLADSLSRIYAIPLKDNLLIRHRHLCHQTSLDSKERWTNIQGAFKITSLQPVYGKRFLLVDDLLTTGATASEAARTLKHAGALTVGLLTVAVTP